MALSGLCLLMHLYRNIIGVKDLRIWFYLALLVGVVTSLLGTLSDPNEEVVVEVINFQPDAIYEYTFPGTDISFFFEGIAEVKWTVCNDRRVTIQQTPDLKSWLDQTPLEVTQLPNTEEGCHVYQGVFQILIDPVDLSDTSQFFRARIVQ